MKRPLSIVIVHNDIYEVFTLNTMEGNNIGVSGNDLVEMDLTQV